MTIVFARRKHSRSAGRIAPFIRLLCVLVASAIAATACGGAATSDGKPSGTRVTALGVDAVYSFIAATGDQLIEGDIFYYDIAHLRNRLAARCMTALTLGASDNPLVQYDEKYLDQALPGAPGFEGPDTGRIPGLYDMALLSKDGALMVPIPIGVPNGPNNLPTATQRTVDADYFMCLRMVATKFEKLYSEGYALNRLWLSEVISIQTSLPVKTATTGFGTCVRRNGAPASASLSVVAYRNWLYSVTQPRQYPYGKTALIKSLVDIDRRWTRVFVMCASLLESLMQHLQLQAQRVFLESHHQEVRALERLAPEIARSASRSA